MLEQPLKAYGIFFVVQIVILLVAYTALRLTTKLRVLMTFCLSASATAILTLLLLWFDRHYIGSISRTDVQEYVLGTFIVAAPFMLILMGKLLAILLKHIGKNLAQLSRDITSGQSTAGPERARILRMIEEGKITAEEGSGLLEAMGKSNALRGQDRFSRLDMAMLCGVALVVLGFFLPWVHIRSTTQMLGAVSGYQAGYHAGALGWAVFIIAILSVIPVFVTPENFLYKISMLQTFLTIVGTVLVVSILVRVGGHLGAGLVICLVGFITGLVASVAKFKSLAA